MVVLQRSLIINLLLSHAMTNQRYFIIETINKKNNGPRMKKYKGCGKEFTKFHRISGGNMTSPNQYPWMVIFTFFNGVETYQCGGSIISERHVLTAKHCTDETSQYNPLKIGVHDINNPENYKEVEIEKAVLPTNIDPNDHDISILLLKKPLDLRDPTVGTVCLPKTEKEDYRGKMAKAMGWGLDSSNKYGQFLKTVELEVTYKQAEYYLYTKVDKVNGLYQDPCSGDSGGPLLYKEDGRWTVIGILSGGGYDCQTNSSNGDSSWNKVTAHLKWINSIIGNVSQAALTTVSAPSIISAPTTLSVPTTVPSPITVSVPTTVPSPTTVPALLKKAPATVPASIPVSVPTTVSVPISVPAPTTVSVPTTVPEPTTVSVPITVVAPTTVPALLNKVSCVRHGIFIWMGMHNLKITRTQTAMQCAQKCNTLSRCSFWNWNVDAICFLKNDQPQMIPTWNNGGYSKLHYSFISGPKGCYPNNKDDKCMTNGGKQSGIVCTFPFFFNGIKYNECTSVRASKPWCATIVNNNREYLKEMWGYCASGCIKATTLVSAPTTLSIHTTVPPPTTISVPTSILAPITLHDLLNKDDKCMTNGGKQSGTVCVLPFIYNGIKYNKCTSVRASKPWCATVVNSNREYAKDNWGYCASECSKEEQKKESATKITKSTKYKASAPASKRSTEDEDNMQQAYMEHINNWASILSIDYNFPPSTISGSRHGHFPASKYLGNIGNKTYLVQTRT